MSIYILPTQPRIGKEKDNIDDIVRALGSLEGENILCIVSNSAIMGLGAETYGGLSDFFPRQRAALERLQQSIPERCTVVCAVWVENIRKYCPVAVSKERFSYFDNVYVYSLKEKIHRIAFLCSSKDSFPITDELDVCVLLEEFPFQTYPAIPEQVSLSGRQSSTLKHVDEALFTVISKSLVPCLTIPIYGQSQGVLWDGVFGYKESLDKNIRLLASLPHQCIKFDLSSREFTGAREESQLMIEQIFLKLCQHIRLYVESIGAKGVVVALSGGIDSALVVTLAVLALGPERVFGLLLPGPFSSSHSVSDAEDLCKNLGIRYDTRSIVSLYEKSRDTLGIELSSLSLENLQARLRGILLMSYSNQCNFLALNTCNKSEDMVGYATLYGDAVGAFAPLGDLYKTEVYELSRYINMRTQKQLIPASILEKEPSAELREGQKDTDSLPPYDILDAFLQSVVEYGQDSNTVAEQLNLHKNFQKELLNKVFFSQYKRKQSPRVLLVGGREMSQIREKWSENENWMGF